VSYHTGLLAPLFMLFIVTLAQGNPRVLQAKWLVFTGEISFGIYVLQYPVYHLAEFANNCWVHLNVTTFFWLAMALLVAIAGLLHIAIERPMRRWITGS